MDNPAAPISSTPLQPAIQPVVSSPAEFPNRRWLLWLAGGLAVLVFGVAIGVFSAKFLNESQSSSQLVPTSTSVQSPTSTPTPDLTREPDGSAATADWKEFKDDESGAKFKHPVDWIIDPQKQTQNVIVALDNGDKGVFTFQRAPQGIGLECAKIITEETAYLNEIKAYKTITQTTTGDECGNSDSRETIWISFDKNSVKYLVTYHYLGTNDNQERQLFDQILSTFHFLK